MVSAIPSAAEGLSRPRGGALRLPNKPIVAEGLSPPTRGSRIWPRVVRHHERSIPAHAGEPHRPWRTCAKSTVYPRPRGGASCRLLCRITPSGLSPPTRGSHLLDRAVEAHLGSIPAHAGEP